MIESVLLFSYQPELRWITPNFFLSIKALQTSRQNSGTWTLEWLQLKKNSAHVTKIITHSVGEWFFLSKKFGTYWMIIIDFLDIEIRKSADFIFRYKSSGKFIFRDFITFTQRVIVCGVQVIVEHERRECCCHRINFQTLIRKDFWSSAIVDVNIAVLLLNNVVSKINKLWLAYENQCQITVPLIDGHLED